MLKTKLIEYQDEDRIFEGYLAYNDTHDKKPAVLVAHDWSGKNEFACHKANQLAELGYIGFAIDMFGKGQLGHTTEEKKALIQPLMQDRRLVQKRMLAALNLITSLDIVKTESIGAIGFCFGGLCVLDLARSGVDIKGIVSFHGLLQAPPSSEPLSIKSKILALHGFDDPMVPPDHVIAFGQEMTRAKVNWELNMYGNTMHAFTNPKANDPDFGTVYHAEVAQRAWLTMVTFFAELFK